MPPVDTARLKARRDELDLSLVQLAERLDISPGHLSNVLNGSTTPSGRLIHRFSRALDLPVEKIEAGTRTPQGDPSGPPQQPPNTPKSPPKRQDNEQTTGPKRATNKAVA
jgi:transcriptional regulator with XRE-family HTH domain